MDLEYDRKFEEMKKYIPFLENMIKRLENSNTDSNPRQAQLDKIRSLRDLLLDKKKRMKMENLRKCEQVLVNLYAKVEQRDEFPRSNKDELSKNEKLDLNIARSKLKSVVSKLKPDNVETLPEIARASETEEICVPGSKEPALFQRRPNLPSSTSLSHSSSTNQETSKPKNSYTRVLLSPTRTETYRTNETSSGKPLFSRCSPKKSPRKRSPYKRERKKSSKNKIKYNQSRDLNITLNVPEDKIDSLNTKDILSRIINCSDNDVDIASLRELRTQILGELKETGTSDDISDIILKSYKSKNIEQSTACEKTEIEEGELSDSESEAIESIYGSLVVLDKNKAGSSGSNSSDKEKQRKIQLRLVYSDKTKSNVHEDKIVCVDTSDFETFNKQIDKKSNDVSLLGNSLTSEDSKDNVGDDLLYNELILDQSNKDVKHGTPCHEKIDVRKEEHKIELIDLVSSNTKSFKIDDENKITKNNDIKSKFFKSLVDVEKEEKKNKSENTEEFQQLKSIPQSNKVDKKGLSGSQSDEIQEVCIPLLEPTKPILVPSKEVSEIDILQALKKEILCETTNVLNTDVTTSAVNTPLLHQPKITKVSNAKEIGPKKRISIENYKAKTSTLSSILSIDTVRHTKEDSSRKQSLKLTEKECERFNFLSKLTLTESSDDEDKSSLSLEDVYVDLAPKSPDHDDFADTGIKPPVIIPSDPVQNIAVGSELDVDMRKLLPKVKANELITTPLMSPIAEEILKPNFEKDKTDEGVSLPLADPRIKRDVTSVTNQDALNLQTVNVEKIQSPLSSINADQTQAINVSSRTKSIELNMTPNIPTLLPKMTPNRQLNSNAIITPPIPMLITPRTPNVANMTPSRTPNILNMTPCRTPNIAKMTPNMTPSHNTFDVEDYSNHKHVYAPMFSSAEPRDSFDKSKENNQTQWDTSDSRQSFWEEKNTRNWSTQRDFDYRENRNDVDYRRSHSMQRDVDYRDIRNSSVQTNRSFDQRDRIQYPSMNNHLFGRLECPPTPTPSFGRLDCPPTPTPSFGRIECPPTPAASFARLDCPPTPVASFGRLDCPPTPTPSFGRGDKPMTPVHSFNRAECSLTPTHYFGRVETIPPLLGPEYIGRSEYKSGSKASWSQDPRLNRGSDYDNNQRRDDDQDRNYYQERKPYSAVYSNDHQRDYKRYHREKSIDRNDRNKSYEPSHNYRDQLHRRSTSVGRSFNKEDIDYNRSYSKEYENDRYSRNRGNRGRGFDHRYHRDSKGYDESNRRSYHYDKSGGNTQEMNECRDYTKSTEQNKLRINPHAGSFFTIDTSVNSSFQATDARRKSNSDFDARRQRASSVGRTLSSVNRTSTLGSKDTHKTIKNTKSFRRACSVGREIESSTLDFKDVKADLKSFKIKSDFRFSKDKPDLSRAKDSKKNLDPRNEEKLYSPRKNSRDPRMYREYKDSHDKKEYKSGKGDSNKYGIVYSNDNISKGTILGSGYGVKNYKIPKIRRQEVTETSKSSYDVDEDNQISKNSDKKEFDKEHSINQQEEKKVSKKIENIESEVSSGKRNVIKIQDPKNNATKDKVDNNSQKNYEETNDIVNTSSDPTEVQQVERRVTRSSQKSSSEVSMSLEFSPLKRTRNPKKALVVESDSDDNEIIQTAPEDSKKKTLHTLANNQIDAKASQLLDIESKALLNFKNEETIPDEPVSTALKECKQESKIKVKVNLLENATENIKERKQEPEIKSNLTLMENTDMIKLDKPDDTIQEEVAKQKQDDLDSSFGLSDLEFSDNITSDPVIELNTLIANLDHDLNTSKNVHANSKFTKELNLEAMLENLSNKGDKKFNVSIHEHNLGEIQETNKILNNGSEKVCSDVKAESNDIANIAISEDKSISQSNESKIQDSKIGAETSLSEMLGPPHCVQEKNSIVNAEDAHSSDATVTTSGDNVTGNVPSLSLDSDTANSPFAPDSTINTNVEDVESNTILPTGNKSGCEMNSDISSTHTVSKDSLEGVSSDIGTSKEIESIGKLLSILQDKSKIKELLSLLGDQTSENEKIKKKLEKLSEIVSDDELASNESTHEIKLGDEINSKVHDSCNTNNDAPQIGLFKSNKDSNVQDSQKQLNYVNVETKYESKQNHENVIESNIESNCETTNGNKKQSTIHENIVKTTVQSNSEITLAQSEEQKNIVQNNCPTTSVKYEKEENGDKTLELNVSITKTANDENVTTTTINDNEIADDFIKSSSENIITQELDKTNIASNDKNVENSHHKAAAVEGEKPATKKRRRKRAKKWNNKKKQTAIEDKRLTRTDTISVQQTAFAEKSENKVAKKPSRELKKLQEDIREMFLKEDILNATGIRMCRIAKLVDDKKSKDDDASINESNSQEPLLVHKKCSDSNSLDKLPEEDKISKKKISKNSKGNKSVDANTLINKTLNVSDTETDLQTKTKLKQGKPGTLDPYDFESYSLNDINNASVNDSCSESESESIGSNKSAEGMELSDLKKKVKRKRGRLWQAGVIKSKSKKKKCDLKLVPTTSADDIPELQTCKLPDFTCFTDRNYCFRKQVVTYSCRICVYNGTDIVHHYKNEHPHTEVPLSRLSPAVAKEAIKESEDANFQEISKISSKKYVCRFCFKEFSKKKRLLEAFFWHVVSMHTGEYKHTCSKCIDTQICPLDIDIPPPPKDANGQLLGYICEKCNYTQISLENLKTHVIVWHNDEQTAVYTINLASLSKSAINYLLNQSEPGADSGRPRVLRSSRSKQSMADASDSESDSTEENDEKPIRKLHKKENTPVAEIMTKTSKIQSKITFESDITDEMSNFDLSDTAAVKIESTLNEIQNDPQSETENRQEKVVEAMDDTFMDKSDEPTVPQDIFDYAHFKILYTESGSRVYVCCINGHDYHYKTSLLISMKKHIQLNHTEKWDGYCCICKVIVTPQGDHIFKDCFQHFLDKHIDSFPVLEQIPKTQINLPESNKPTISEELADKAVSSKSYINVRRMSDLISNSSEPQLTVDSDPVLPVIESVISLGANVEQTQPSPSYPTSRTEPVETLKQYKYEEFQADIMSRKHRVVLEAMMSPTKLIQVFKCAGRFCSFTTDSPEEALLHASTHLRVGGVDSLCCVYCDFDACENAIDLITHVFKYHGCCPYTCSLCFYRAAANPLVNAHIKRVHSGATNGEILKTTYQTESLPEDNILTRDAAVPYYLCCDKSSSDVQCKFRTYTPGKFCEHLQTRHSSSSEFLCFICATSVDKPTELIRHFKTHGLKLYQCTWCVFGAVDEKELLEHASAMHPARQPKAYLRIITKKEGTTEHRVLPLAHLNKSDVPSKEVPRSEQKSFPVREAERSIELEKLIGHTNSMIGSMSEGTETSGKTNVSATENTQNETSSELQSVLEEDNILENAEARQLIARMTTPPPAVLNDKDRSECSTPILKTITLEETPKKVPHSEPEIVCLDSDDEMAPPEEASLAASQAESVQVQSTSESLVQNEMKKVDLTELFACSKCHVILKCGSGFRKHINACFSNMVGLIPCAHCPQSLAKNNIVTHYNRNHCNRNKVIQHVCQKCSLVFNSANLAKDHMLIHHNMATACTSLTGFIKQLAQDPKTKRKRCTYNRDKSFEPPEKVMRYGPEDIDKLPINPILDDSVVCSLCEFHTKVRLNMVRHLQLHAQQQPVPQTAPVNPVPHLETNEKHFDKMLNLASSSIGLRPGEKSGRSDSASVMQSVPPETQSRYPKYVCDKQRLTCGAKGCSYISVDESMLKCHWETLHYGTTHFYCAHCPSYQQMDKTKPVTAARILAHLKMHEDKLFACSVCSFYHCRLQNVEKHLADVHKGGQALIVRDGKPAETNAPNAPTASLPKPPPAPTMDLKPWQCGLCKFKSLLRPEVVDHCAKVHNSKMQYKCAYCAFRTSNPENITKHQSKSHVGKQEEIFYYYYREGTVPDDSDGNTRWQKQSQNTVTSEPKVKCEILCDIPPSSPQKLLPALTSTNPAVDLNLVKKEIEPVLETIDDLCREFGQFCEPNGLKYKCPLCKNVIEDSLEAMQSHLYEELKYRKWGCSICSYKAFHKEGLADHMQTEHRQNRDPIKLPANNRVEVWVTKLLEHQTSFITRYKENLAKQKEEILRTGPGPSTSKVLPQQTNVHSTTPPLISGKTHDSAELEKIFGPFGSSIDLSFCCPKCSSSFKEEDVMHNHLESELNKIRWYCSNCSMKFQTYHEAQFHSRSVHIGQGARPIEVTRDATVRAAWIAAVIKTQKHSMDVQPVQKANDNIMNEMDDMSQPSDNSLLVVRYEKKIPTPEEEMARRTPISTCDSDDEKLIIDEPLENRLTKPTEKCPHCKYATVSSKTLRVHLLRHYSLKPYSCAYCELNGTRKGIEKHQKIYHSTKPINLLPAAIPNEPPHEFNKKLSNTPVDAVKVVCLVCRNYFTESETLAHTHDRIHTTFGKKGEVVVRCNECHTLHKDVNAFLRHHKANHFERAVNYVFSKLNTIDAESKELLYACENCPQKFSHLKDMKIHADANHQSILKYTLVPKCQNLVLEMQESMKRKCADDSMLPACKRTARKSTTKLPSYKNFARKSTTKLPYNVVCETLERSWYGQKPSSEGLDDVVTVMPFCNKMVPFTLNKLKDIINIDPVVMVSQINVPDCVRPENLD